MKSLVCQRLKAKISRLVGCVLAGTALALSTGVGYAAVDELVVTATKRNESILVVPMSITAISGEDLELQGADQLADFLLSAPGVALTDNGGGDLNISIRGISSTLGDSPVGYYLDEAPFTSIDFVQVPDVRTWDLERVEVLRGPQGTLYGASSLGGTVRILTKDPVLNEFEAKLDLTGSTTQDSGESYGLKGAINIPIVDDILAVRFAGTHEDFSGWTDQGDFLTKAFLGTTVIVDEEINDRQISTYRGKLLFEPTEKFSAVLSYFGYDLESGSDSQASDEGVSFFPFAQATTVEYGVFNGILTYETDWFDIVSASTYIDHDSSVREVFSGGFSFGEREIFAQEIRLVSNTDGPLRWTAGLYYRDLTSTSEGATGMLNSTSESYAFFGEGTYSLFDEKLELTAGLRYFKDKRARDDTGFTFNPITFLPLPVDVQGSATFDTINPRFSAAFFPDDSWMIYASAAKGFRSGSIQTGTNVAIADLFMVSVPIGIDEETAWTYEIGTKKNFLEGLAIVEASVYYTDWDNLQTIINVTPTVGALINVGAAHAVGVDFAITTEPIEGLSLSISGNLNKSEYGEDVIDAFGVMIVSDGDRIINTPKFTISSSATYQWDLGIGDLQGLVRGEIQHNTTRTFSFGALVGESDKITQASARVGVNGEHWGLYLFGENLTNNQNRVTAPLPFFPFDDTTIRLRPRTFGVNLKLNI